jgi:hypothetical protein
MKFNHFDDALEDFLSAPIGNRLSFHTAKWDQNTLINGKKFIPNPIRRNNSKSPKNEIRTRREVMVENMRHKRETAVMKRSPPRMPRNIESIDKQLVEQICYQRSMRDIPRPFQHVQSKKHCQVFVRPFTLSRLGNVSVCQDSTLRRLKK